MFKARLSSPPMEKRGITLSINGNNAAKRLEQSPEALLPKLGFLVAAVFFSLFSRMVFSPLLPIMVQDLGITHSEGGAFFFHIALGYATSMLVSGFLSQRITHRWTIALALFTAAFGLALIALSSTALFMPAGFLIVGVGTGLYPPSGITTLTNLVEAERWGRASAIHEMGPNAAFILAPFVVSLALAVAEWRLVLWGTAVACATSGVFFLRWGQGGRFPGVPPHLSKVFVLLRSRTFLVVLLYFLVAMSVFLGVYSMLPSYLVAERGMGESTVNNIVGLSRVSGLFMIFVAGMLVDRVHAGKLLASLVLIVSVAIIGIGVLRGVWLIVAIIVQAMAASAFYPTMLTVLTRVSPDELRSLSVSVTIPFAYIGGAGLVPYLLGVTAEYATFSGGFVVLGILIALTVFAARLVPAGRI